MVCMYVLCGCVFMWQHGEEPLALPISVHINSIVQRRQFASPESAETSSCDCGELF